jgi:single-strand DNA-binding protein
MSSVNKVILIGNLGRDPETRTFANGGMVCNLRIATSESWKDKSSGDKKERTEWHSVAIMSEPLAKLAERFLKKGSKVYLEGQLETRKWQDQSGADKYSTEVVLRPFNSTMTFLDGPSGGERPDEQKNRDHYSTGARGGAPAGGVRGGLDDMDDEIPFMCEWR